MIRSDRATEAMASAAFEELQNRFMGACTRMSDTIDDPFSTIAQGKLKAQSSFSSMAIWIDIPKEGKAILVRGIDLESLLEWGQVKASTVGINDESLNRLAANLSLQVVDQYPAIGIIDGSTFFTWSKTPSLKAHIERRQGIERHPFLPYILHFRTSPIDQSEIHLEKENSLLWSLSFSKPPTPALTDRHWIK